MNKNLRDLAKRTHDKSVPDLEDITKEYTYVPSLKMFVKNTLEEPDYFWDAKKTAAVKGAIIMTPAHFWHYYDFCEQEKLKYIDEANWLDAAHKPGSMFIPNPGMSISTGIIGNQYTIPTGSAFFTRDAINDALGMPNGLTDDSYSNFIYNIEDYEHNSGAIYVQRFKQDDELVIASHRLSTVPMENVKLGYRLCFDEKDKIK